MDSTAAESNRDEVVPAPSRHGIRPLEAPHLDVPAGWACGRAAGFRNPRQYLRITARTTPPISSECFGRMNLYFGFAGSSRTPATSRT